MKAVCRSVLLLWMMTILTFPVSARTWKLDYRLKGQVVAIELNEVVVYTDVPSFMNALSTPEFRYKSDSLLAMLLRQKQRMKSADTLHVACWELQGFDEDIEAEEADTVGASDLCNNWQYDDVLIRLADSNRLHIYDKRSQRRIRIITTKNIGSIASGHLRRAYIDPVTEKELFAAILCWTISGCPKF